MKGPIDVENCCLAISYIPLSSISAVLLLHLTGTAEKSLLCTVEATGLQFHCSRGRLRRNKSSFNTTSISNYPMWAKRIQKTRREKRALGTLHSFLLGRTVLLWGFQNRKPGQSAHLKHSGAPWTRRETSWIFPFFFFFFGHLEAYGFSRPGIRYKPQLQLKPQLQQHQILNSLCRARDWTCIPVFPLRHSRSSRPNFT